MPYRYGPIQNAMHYNRPYGNLPMFMNAPPGAMPTGKSAPEEPTAGLDGYLKGLTDQLAPLVGRITDIIKDKLQTIGPNLIPDYQQFASFMAENEQHIAAGAVIAMSTFVTVITTHQLLARNL